MIPVEGGTFLMGDASGAAERDTKQARRVTVGDFSIGKFEVTFDDYDEFCAETGRGKPGDKGWGRGRMPAVNVSWYDAVGYCNRLSRKEGLRQVYSGGGKNPVCDFSANGYLLPTEAEWEFAAKGGSRSGGFIYAGGNDSDGAAWYSGNAKETTHPAGEKQANELGIFDMSGNAWEWCWDLYGSYEAGQVTDPRGPETGTFRVIRGGSWHRDKDKLRTASRGYFDPADRGTSVGFRIARSR
jgi:formylglycine-generating enzyme required for sulfatase activity